MYPYQKPQMELLLDLVKQANPGITLPFTPATMRTSIPVAQSVPPGGIVDTNVVISPKTNDSYTGSVKVQYRRIDLSKSFRNMTPVPVNFYSALTQVPLPLLVTKFNEQYGTSFTVNDFTNPVTQSYPTATTFSLNVAASSLCYQPGSLLFAWQNRKPTLPEVTTGMALTGRLFPGGNDLDAPGRKPQGEYLAYSVDNTWPGGLNGANAGSGVVIVSDAWATLFSPLKAADPRFTEQLNHTVPGGLNGLNYASYNLPNPLVPEANSTLYKFAMLIIAQPSSWFQGRLILHYN
jgi:hypothetical protein